MTQDSVPPWATVRGGCWVGPQVISQPSKRQRTYESMLGRDADGGYERLIAVQVTDWLGLSEISANGRVQLIDAPVCDIGTTTHRLVAKYVR